MSDQLRKSLDHVAFGRYLDIVARAIAGVRGRFPYDDLIRGLHRELRERPIVVTIHGDAGDATTDIVCRFDGRRFERDAKVSPGDGSIRWTLQRTHVLEVITEPWRYLADPSRLEMPPLSLVTLDATRERAQLLLRDDAGGSTERSSPWDEHETKREASMGVRVEIRPSTTTRPPAPRGADRALPDP